MGANSAFTAFGAAAGGYKNYAEWLRHEYGDVITSFVAYGAGFGGHIPYIDFLLTKSAKVDDIVFGAAAAGKITVAENYRDQNNKKHAVWMVRGLASSGNIEYAQQLCTQHNIDPEDIACWAAFGGHKIAAEQLRTIHGLDVDLIAQHAAAGGHMDYVMTLSKTHKLNMWEVLNRAATSGHHKFVLENLRGFSESSYSPRGPDYFTCFGYALKYLHLDLVEHVYNKFRNPYPVSHFRLRDKNMKGN